ncbi:hypothetical protein EV126DRAFT_49381 [Verticillium dahliae]|nr:hypothetical protein EV126DRAFT_49381 [Verticillium dahliae]
MHGNEPEDAGRLILGQAIQVSFYWRAWMVISDGKIRISAARSVRQRVGQLKLCRRLLLQNWLDMDGFNSIVFFVHSRGLLDNAQPATCHVKTDVPGPNGLFHNPAMLGFIEKRQPAKEN